MKKKKPTDIQEEIKPAKEEITIDPLSPHDMMHCIPKVKSGDVRERKQYEKIPVFDKAKFKNNPERTWSVKMYFNNGTSKSYVLKTKESLFELNKKHYYLIPEMAVYDLTMRQYELCYLENYTVPMDRNFIIRPDPNDPKNTLISRIFRAITPSNIREFIRLRVLEVIINAHNMEKWLKMAAIFGMVSSGLSLINLLIGTGVFKG